jgi:proteasome lid subunit RPN8/RPN11
MVDLPPEDNIEVQAVEADAALIPWDPWADQAVRLALFGDELTGPLAFFSADTLYDMQGHGNVEDRREVAGVLVGNFVESSRGAITRVEDIVIADTSEASLTHVTFTHESWNRIYAALERRDDGVRIVGWYHTHPGFGPFLSAHDLFIHENFFPNALQVALVLDPVQSLFGVFGWREGKVDRHDGCYVYDGIERAEELDRLVASLTYARQRPARRAGWLSWLSKAITCTMV